MELSVTVALATTPLRLNKLIKAMRGYATLDRLVLHRIFRIIIV